MTASPFTQPAVHHLLLEPVQTPCVAVASVAGLSIVGGSSRARQHKTPSAVLCLLFGRRAAGVLHFRFSSLL